MADQTAAKQVLLEMVDRYEEMFAQFSAIRTVLAESPQAISLLARLNEVLLQSTFRAEVRAKFQPLCAAISQATQDSEVLALVRQIPLVAPVR